MNGRQSTRSTSPPAAAAAEPSGLQWPRRLSAWALVSSLAASAFGTIVLAFCNRIVLCSVELSLQGEFGRLTVLGGGLSSALCLACAWAAWSTPDGGHVVRKSPSGCCGGAAGTVGGGGGAIVSILHRLDGCREGDTEGGLAIIGALRPCCPSGSEMLLLKLSFSPSLLPTQYDLPDASPGTVEAAAAPDNLDGGSLSMMGACCGEGGGGGKSSRMEARLLRWCRFSVTEILLAEPDVAAAMAVDVLAERLLAFGFPFVDFLRCKFW